MPITPTSGASLQPISLTAPAFKGLNKQNETAILGPEWATVLTNCAFDRAGRVTSRKGSIVVSDAAGGAGVPIQQLFEYIKKDGTTLLICTRNNKIYAGGLPTWTAIYASVSPAIASDNWQFVNYNGYVIGAVSGHTLIQYNGTGTGSFATVAASSGTVPNGNCVVAGSGRVWASGSDGQTIQYSALLDHTKWAIADGAGSIDMSSVWPNGMDYITGLAFFNNLLVVFGKRTIVLFGDATGGGALGIDPSTAIVTDAITGSGCIARDSIREVEGPDLLFLSDQGVQSLQRVIQERSNPVSNVSSNVRDYMMTMVRQITLSGIRSVYSPEESMYLLSLPGAGTTFYFNTQGKLEDGSFRVAEWAIEPSALLRTVGGALYLASTEVGNAYMGQYFGYSDVATSYIMDYASGWLDLGPDLAQYLKILKSLSAVIYTSTSTTAQLKWAYDFNEAFSSATINLTAGGTSEWGSGEWGLMEWSGGLSLRNLGASGSGTGQYIRVGLSAAINGAQISIQQIKPVPKIGRLAK